ncbi:hypothetical protein glysoja_042286 [Glycine soja]|uniref:Uncharacterized protein n=1 Tax=Glycine soja TaxID=3848 RepID=A0A0B2PY06_GLYSO|nr:hypothetical protein JHK86_051825 [Glycine max]KHN12579.1 hypothetical protein glysoja_042286 [Glycine soja]
MWHKIPRRYQYPKYGKNKYMASHCITRSNVPASKNIHFIACLFPVHDPSNVRSFKSKKMLLLTKRDIGMCANHFETGSQTCYP